jgi:hypothetical protein
VDVVDCGQALPDGARRRRVAVEDLRPSKTGVDRAIDVASGVEPPRGLCCDLRAPAWRGFNAPASRFMWALCYYYEAELHN